jgi:hypothetical protein
LKSLSSGLGCIGRKSDYLFPFERAISMSEQELHVIIRPDRLQVEWTDTTERYSEQSRQLQQELYRRYHAEPDAWLLWLGFADARVHLPPSLAFWRDVAGTFTTRLAHLPDVEELRERIGDPNALFPRAAAASPVVSARRAACRAPEKRRPGAGDCSKHLVADEVA